MKLKKSVFKNTKGNKSASKTCNARNIFTSQYLEEGGGANNYTMESYVSEDDTTHTNSELHNRQNRQTSTGVISTMYMYIYMSVSSVLNNLYTILVFFKHAILPLEEQ